VNFNLRASEGAADKGGGPCAGQGKLALDSERLSLGVALASGSEARLAHVLSGGAAERAGLAAGDILVAIDALRVTGGSLDAHLAHRRPGDAVTIHAFRRDELFSVTAMLEASPLDTCWLAIDGAAAPAARALREAWLGAS